MPRMTNDGYRILCFEKGTAPIFSEQVKDYITFTYKELVVDKMQTAINKNEYERIYSDVCGIEKLLLKDVEQFEGKELTIKMMNQILQERTKRGNTTILIGMFIPQRLLKEIPENSVFCTDKR